MGGFAVRQPEFGEAVSAVLGGRSRFAVFRLHEEAGGTVVRAEEPGPADFLDRFPADRCQYALYTIDLGHETTPVLIRWAPDTAPREQRLRYARYEALVHRALSPDVRHTLSAAHHADLSEPATGGVAEPG